MRKESCFVRECWQILVLSESKVFQMVFLCLIVSELMDSCGWSKGDGESNALWPKKIKHPDVSTDPLTRPFTRLLASLIRLLCAACFACALCAWKSELLMLGHHALLDHSVMEESCRKEKRRKKRWWWWWWRRRRRRRSQQRTQSHAILRKRPHPIFP